MFTLCSKERQHSKCCNASRTEVSTHKQTCIRTLRLQQRLHTNCVLTLFVLQRLKHTLFLRSAVDERQKVKLLRTPCLWLHRSAGLLVFGYYVLTLLMLQRFKTKVHFDAQHIRPKERLNKMCFDAATMLSVKK